MEPQPDRLPTAYPNGHHGRINSNTPVAASFVASARSRLLTAVGIVPVALALPTSLSFAPEASPDATDSDFNGLCEEDEIGYHLTEPILADAPGNGASNGEGVNFDSAPLIRDSLPGRRIDASDNGVSDDDEPVNSLTDPAVGGTVGTVPATARRSTSGHSRSSSRAPYATPPAQPRPELDPQLVPAPKRDRIHFLGGDELAFLRQLTALQTGMGPAPVWETTACTLAAISHSRDRDLRVFFSHSNSDGINHLQRMHNAAYVLGDPYGYAKNFGDAYAPGAVAFTTWRNSQATTPTWLIQTSWRSGSLASRTRARRMAGIGPPITPR